MKKMIFKNKEIKDLYDEYVNSRLSIIINDSIKEYDNMVVSDIYFNDHFLNIIICGDIGTVNVSFDFYKFIIDVVDNNKPYKTVYENSSKSELSPDYYVYEKGNNKVIKRNINSFNKENENNYEYYINNNIYFIKVIGNIDDDFIIYLLNFSDTINNINDLVDFLSNIIDFSNVELFIKDKNNLISIKNGKLINYNYQLEKDDNINKELYYKDDNYYIKETKITKLDNDNDYIKRIGVYNGKRRKEN